MRMKKRSIHNLVFIFLVVSLFFLEIKLVASVPIGPTISYLSNSTRSTLSNTTVNSSQAGGYIFTLSLNSVEQNLRWKAYVGNVTGALTLDDANSYTIFSWDLGLVSGEVYATRNSSSVNWSNVNCSWAAAKNESGYGNFTNRSVDERENVALSHTRLDNITGTFSTRSHPSMQVGEVTIGANECYSIRPYVNGTTQSSTFSELLLTDGSDLPGSKLIYGSFIKHNATGYNANSTHNLTYDFEMLVPEVGSDVWSSSTAYYFYVELS